MNQLLDIFFSSEFSPQHRLIQLKEILKRTDDIVLPVKIRCLQIAFPALSADEKVDLMQLYSLENNAILHYAIASLQGQSLVQILQEDCPTLQHLRHLISLLKLVPNLWNNCGESQNDNMSVLFRSIQKLSQDSSDLEVVHQSWLQCAPFMDRLSENHWTLLQDVKCSGMADKRLFLLKFLSSLPELCVPSPSVFSIAQFWDFLMQCLLNPSGSERKMALFLLRRFFNHIRDTHQLSELRELGLSAEPHMEMVLTLVDVLEETQSHVIMPVLSLWWPALSAAWQDGHVHFVWLRLILERGLMHESSIIAHWAIVSTLALRVPENYSDYTVDTANLKHFLQNNLLTHLNNNRLFAYAEPSLPPEEVFLLQPLQQCFSHLADPRFRTLFDGEFWRGFAIQLSSTHWSPFALLFICRALSRCDVGSLPNFCVSSLCTNQQLGTVDVRWRVAIQMYVVRILLRNVTLHLPASVYKLPFSCPPLEALYEYLNSLHDLDLVMVADGPLWRSCVETLAAEKCCVNVTCGMEFPWCKEECHLSAHSSRQATSLALLVAMLFHTGQCESVENLLQFVHTWIEKAQQVHHNPYLSSTEVLLALLAICKLGNYLTFMKGGDEASRAVFGSIANLRTVQFCVQEAAVANADSMPFVVDILSPQFCSHLPADIHSQIAQYLLDADSPLTWFLAAPPSLCFHLDAFPWPHAHTWEAKLALCGHSLTHQLAAPCRIAFWRVYRTTLQHMQDRQDMQDILSLQDWQESFQRMTDLAIASADVGELKALLKTLGRVLNYATSKELPTENVASTVEHSLWPLWTRVMECGGFGQIFREVFTTYIRHVLTHSWTMCASLTRASLLEVCESVLEAVFCEGVSHPGLVFCTCRCWFHNLATCVESELRSQVLLTFRTWIGRCVTFGLVITKSVRQESRVLYFLSQEEPSAEFNRVMKLLPFHERLPVFELLTKLPSILPDEGTSQVSAALREDFLHQLKAQKQRPGKRSYDNSEVHRVRHRVATALMLLLPTGVQTEESDTCFHEILCLLETETFASVRYQLQWAAVRLLTLQDAVKVLPMFTDTLNSLQEAPDSKPAFVCSLLTILMLAVQFGSISQVAVSQFATALFPWLASQNHNVRLHVALCVHLLHSLDSADSLITSTAHLLERSSGLTKKVNALREHFLWSRFHPERDFNLQSLLFSMPRLCGLLEDELIPVAMLRDDVLALPKVPFSIPVKWQGSDDGNDSSCSLETWEAQRNLAGGESAAWRVRVDTVVRTEEDEEGCGDGVVSSELSVQRKPQYWLTAAPDESQQSSTSSMGKQVILVTTLIDKPNNIGGLARTCEIFGVSEFVVANMRILEDKAFQHLSLTAEKWLTVVEVPRKALLTYLEEKRTEGFTLMGVEQASNSRMLHNVTFDEKSLLLLGNEREGIPPNVLARLDVCVEVPQRGGMIRSLNVHVTGALVLWEHFKQARGLSSSVSDGNTLK